jgi:hypothetical protein
MTDLLGDRLDIDHARGGRLLDQVTDGRAERTIDGPVQLHLTVRDHDRHLLRSSLVDEPVRLVFDQPAGEITLRLAGVKKQGDQLTCRWVDDVVWRLRGQTGFRERNDGDVSAFAGQLAAEVDVDARGVQPGATVDGKQVARGDNSQDTPAADDESSWDALSRYADQLDWRLFSLGRILVLAGDGWLADGNAVAAGGRDPIEVVEHDGPVGAVDGDSDAGKRAKTATVELHDVAGWTGEAWGPAPSTPVELADVGPLSGRWLVSKVALDSLWSQLATVTLTRRNEDGR